jgi:hypothetical protein
LNAFVTWRDGAPSATNTQRWTGHVLTCAALQRLTKGLMVAANEPNEVKEAEQPYYSTSVL